MYIRVAKDKYNSRVDQENHTNTHIYINFLLTLHISSNLNLSGIE